MDEPLVDTLSIGTAVGPTGRYRCIRPLGSGANGTVYLAHDSLLENKAVALKVFHPEHRDRAQSERYLREVTIAQSVIHTHIVRTYELIRLPSPIGEAQLAIVMEYVDGLSLASILREGNLSEVEALDTLRQLAVAIQALHDRGIRHGDIKPGNILRTSDGVIKLADFGSASLTAVTDDGTRRTLDGTVRYCSPEQLAQEHCDERSDIYSFGVVMEELLRGNEWHRRSNSGFLKRLGLGTTLSPAYALIIATCLAENPDNRFQHISEVLEALEAAGQRRSAIRRINVLAPILRVFGGAVLAAFLAVRVPSYFDANFRTWLSYEVHTRTSSQSTLYAATLLLGIQPSAKRLITDLASLEHISAVDNILRQNSRQAFKEQLDARTLYEEAYRKRNLLLATVFFEHGLRADPNALLDDGYRLIEHALFSGDSAWIKLIGEKGWNAAEIGRLPMPPLFLVARNHDPSVIRFVVDRGADPSLLHNGVSVLHYASSAPTPTLQAFLDLPMNIEVKDPEGRPPTLHAISASKIGNIVLFLMADADLSGKDCWGLSIGHHLTRTTPTVVDIIVSVVGPEVLHSLNREGNTPLHMAIINGPDDVVWRLIHHGASLTQRNYVGLTPLMVGIYGQRWDRVVELSKLDDEQLRIVDGFGELPLAAATRRQAPAAVLAALSRPT